MRDDAPTDGPTDAAPTDDGYDAIVYDLDGTLIDLDVDWQTVADDAAEMFADAGIDATGVDLWEMFDLAAEQGFEAELESIVTAHEEEGARRSERLRTADEVGERGAPVGVCSLNSESACRIALAMHELEADVEAVVGRDSVATRKPDPEPLSATLRELDAAPERTVFVGDARRDERTAERAGVAFRYVEGGPAEP